jgi:hypothetical protein
VRKGLWIFLVATAMPLVAIQPAAVADAQAAEWVWPLDPAPTVLRLFQPPPVRWLAGHRGVDLMARFGQEVRSAGAGVVGFAGMVAGRPVVTVSHGRFRTTYEPVEPNVQIGDHLRAGEPIGTLSRTNGHCGVSRPCLHWGLLRGLVYLDPLALLRTGPVRLLPLNAGGPSGAQAGRGPVAQPDHAAPRRPQWSPPAGSGKPDRAPTVGPGAIAGGSSALVLAALGMVARRRRRAP